MSRKDHSPAERVCEGIRTLDYAATKGNCPRNWRNRIRLDNLRLASYQGSPLQQIFGDFHEGERILRCHLNVTELGYFSKFVPGDTESVKKEWKKALHTSPNWTKIGDKYFRIIKGEHFGIYQESNGLWKILKHNPLLAMNFPAKYNSLESAKRAVRRFTNEKSL